MNIKISNDVNMLIEVLHKSFDRYKIDPQPSSALAETVESLQAELNANTTVYAGFENEKMVAMVKTTETDTDLYFARLGVIPEMQGKGYAKKLLAFLEQLTLEKQKQYITCRVRKSEPANIKLYTSLGYEIDFEEKFLDPTGQLLDIYFLRKKLA